MRVFKVKVFARFQRKERLGDEALCGALRDIEAGLVDAELGGGLIKQRVARQGKGKRGGYRTIIAYRTRGRAIFLFGYAKSDKADLSPDEIEDLVEIGASWLNAIEQEIEEAVADERLKEIQYGAEDEVET